MTEKMPSSTRFGSRPSADRTRSYSCGESPCSATISGVMAGAVWVMARHVPARARDKQSLNRFCGCPDAGEEERRRRDIDKMRGDVPRNETGATGEKNRADTTTENKRG